MEWKLAESETNTLLRAARESILAGMKKKPPPPAPDEIPPALMENRGAFVTLHKEGKLRGCIGYIDPIKPMYEAVVCAAQSSAFEDPRFPPVSEEEMGLIEIEISILSPATPVDSWEDIRIGEHGIVLKKGIARALFLPHVAVENNWDLETTLTHLAVKAGLYGQDWREGAQFEVFTSDTFSEKNLG